MEYLGYCGQSTGSVVVQGLTLAARNSKLSAVAFKVLGDMRSIR